MGSLLNCGMLSITAHTHIYIYTHTDNTPLLFHLIPLLLFLCLLHLHLLLLPQLLLPLNRFLISLYSISLSFYSSPRIPAWLSICRSGCHMITQELQEAPGRMVETRCISGGIDHGFISWLAYGSTLSPLMRIKVLQLLLLFFLSFLRLPFAFLPFFVRFDLYLSIYLSICLLRF